MKRLMVMLLGAAMCCVGNAQVVEEGESALVYYSPKTTVVLDFTYTVETQEPGIYAKYAEELIGATDVVKDNQTTYTLKNVRIGSTTTTDYERPHKVSSESGIPMLLSINEKGILVGYNVLPAEKQAKQNQYKTTTKPGNNPDKFLTGVAPYPEEVLKAGKTPAQANAVAQQIFHLRETRMYLLSGEVEHAPADGRAMELVLGELNRQEKALTELFVGKKSKKTLHKEMLIIPNKAEKLYFFSEENGFTDGDNIDADTIRVSLKNLKQELKAPSQHTKKKKEVELSPIVYNLPGTCDVQIHYQGKIIGNKTIPVAQHGVDVPLSKDLFTGTELPRITFSEKTGNIISISK